MIDMTINVKHPALNFQVTHNDTHTIITYDGMFEGKEKQFVIMKLGKWVLLSSQPYSKHVRLTLIRSI